MRTSTVFAIAMCFIVVYYYIAMATGTKDDVFRAWSSEHGIHRPCIDVGYFKNNLRGVKATRDIQKGDTLVQMPLDACVYVEVPNTLSMEAQDVALAQELMYHDHPSSPLKGYIDFMPNDVHLIADWSDAEIDRIGHARGRELRREQASENAKHPPEAKRYLDLVRSRRFRFTHEKTTLLVMLPWIDLINHDPDADVHAFEYDLNITDGIVTLKSTRDYAKGKEVIVSYGDALVKDAVEHHLVRHGLFDARKNVDVS